MKNLLMFLGVLVLVSSASAACNINQCSDYNVVKDCGNSFLAHSLSTVDFRTCLNQCAAIRCDAGIFGFLFAVGNDALWAKYDVNRDCFIDLAESSQATTNYGNYQETLSNTVAVIKLYQDQIKNPSCAVPTTTTTTSPVVTTTTVPSGCWIPFICDTTTTTVPGATTTTTSTTTTSTTHATTTTTVMQGTTTTTFPGQTTTTTVPGDNSPQSLPDWAIVGLGFIVIYLVLPKK